MNPSRAHRLAWLVSFAALSLPAGCLEESQDLGEDGGADGGNVLPANDSGRTNPRVDSGAGPTRDSGSTTTNRDSGVVVSNDSGEPPGRDADNPPPGRDAGGPGDSGGPIPDSSSDAGGPTDCPASEGTDGIVLASGQQHLGALAIDTANLYWTANVILNTSGDVLSLPKTGGTPLTLETSQPSALSLTVSQGSLYWSAVVGSQTNPSPNDYASIMTAPSTGGTPTQLWKETEDLQTPYPYEIQADGSNLYWIDIGETLVMETPLGGGTATTIGGVLGVTAVPVGLANDATNVYSLWFGYPSPQMVSLLSVPKSGGSWSSVWSASTGTSYSSMQPAVDSTGIYWVSQGLETGNAGASIMYLPTGGSPTPIVSGLDYPYGVASDGTNLYWDDDDTIWKMPLSGGTPAVLAQGERAGQLLVDNSYVYWGNSCFGTIKKIAK